MEYPVDRHIDIVRMYGTYIPNQKFDFIIISVLLDITEKNGKTLIIFKISTRFILRDNNNA